MTVDEWRPVVHMALHLLVPLAVALACYRSRWRAALAVMLATMVVDLDHLWADPLFDPNRCSLDVHPLHSSWAIFAYCIVTAWPRTRIVGVGLLIHMALDYSDCIWMKSSGTGP